MFPKFLKNKYLLALVTVLALGIGAALWFFGFSPVLSVEGRSANMSEFLKLQSAITQFDKISHANSTSTPLVEIKKQVLGNIIDRMLLDKLVKEIDPSINQKSKDLVRQTVESNQDFSLSEASRKLYGLTEEDFIDLVLIPQAKRNLLAQHFKDEPLKINEIWDNAMKSVDVKIFYPGFYWENGEVKAK